MIALPLAEQPRSGPERAANVVRSLTAALVLGTAQAAGQCAKKRQLRDIEKTG